MELKRKSVVITGGGAGIGREVARQLIDKGATVHAVDLHTDALEASDHLIPHQLNITDRDALSALAEQTGPVDAVVNVAGIVQDSSTSPTWTGRPSPGSWTSTSGAR